MSSNRIYAITLAAHYHANKTPRLTRRKDAIIARMKAGLISQDKALRHLSSAIVAELCGERIETASRLLERRYSNAQLRQLAHDDDGTETNVPGDYYGNCRAAS